MAIRILNGWKEISSYLNRGVRTAQRWERYFGMPVHRPASKQRAAVVAVAAELDSWLMQTNSGISAIAPSRDEIEPVSWMTSPQGMKKSPESLGYLDDAQDTATSFRC